MRSLLTLAIALILSAPSVHAQQPADEYIFFDRDWKPVKEKKANYLLRIHFTKDSCWQFSYYKTYGPLIRIETYKDQRSTIPHGLFAWYDAEGTMDSSGYYNEGLRDKEWILPSETTASKHRTQYYDKGRLLNDKQAKAKIAAESIEDPSYPDPSRESPESYFPGGATGWSEYLRGNLHYPGRAYKHLIDGTVNLLFTIRPTGQLDDIRIIRSVELSLDDEAVRMAEHSPAWVPAIKFNIKVRSSKIQPIVFRFTPGSRR